MAMQLNTSQHLRLEQQMKLSPRLIQAMEILQLPVLALQERIDAELEANPVLELRGPEDEDAGLAREEEPADRGEQPMVVEDESDNSSDFERLAEMEDEYGPDLIFDDLPTGPRKASTPERDGKMDAMANTAAPPESLNEYLLHQWAFVEAPEDIREAGELIINHIDDDGYLHVPLADLPDRTGRPVSIETLREALRLVQALEPTGVGARDLKECLLIQLGAAARQGRDVTLETELVENFLRDIEMNRLPRIAKRTGRDIEDVKAAIENLSHLNPRPGSLIGQRGAPVISPDVTVDLDENGEVVVTMAGENSPRLGLSRRYRRLARDRSTDKEARRFLQKNLRSGQWLIGAIEQRRETVRRVTEEVFQVQREFLDSGPEALKPLPMGDIAEKVGIHVATVSRAVAGKYVQTPRGIFPLRMFFSSGTTTVEGEDVSWDAVKVKLKEIVDHEDKSRPLKDDELAEALKAEGIDIARRTVAKYRKLLNIPQARQRREY